MCGLIVRGAVVAFIGLLLVLAAGRTWAWDRGGLLLFQSAREGIRDTYLLDADRLLLNTLPIPIPNTDRELRTYDAVWSPDGNRVALRSLGRTTILLADFTTLRVQTVTHTGGVEGGLAWSPDGTELAFIASTPVYADVFVLNLTTGAIRQITGDGGGRETSQQVQNHFAPVWSPDGARLAFRARVRDRSGPSHLFVADADGRNRRQVAERVQDRAGILWLNNAALLYERQRGGGVPGVPISGVRELMWVDVDSRAERPIAQAVNNARPALSPDGRWMAFPSSLDSAGNPMIHYTLHLLDVETGVITDMGWLVNGNSDLGWSADGRWVAFNYRSNTTGHLYAGEIATQTLRTLTDGGIDARPRWRP